MIEIVECKKYAEFLKSLVKFNLSKYNFRIKAAIILVGDSQASLTYVSRKIKAAEELSIDIELIHLNKDTKEDHILDLINKLNYDDNIQGILVQLPLPKGLNKDKILNSVNFKKDIDGLHFINSGLLNSMDSAEDLHKVYFFEDFNKTKLNLKENIPIIPATALGSYFLIKDLINLESKKVLIFGDSNLVTRPISRLMLLSKATVIVLNSKSKNIDNLLKEADIIITATGKMNLINKQTIEICQNIKLIVDIGITFNEEGKIQGDISKEIYNYSTNRDIKITKVPGGIGLLTVSTLMFNLMLCGLRQKLNNKKVF